MSLAGGEMAKWCSVGVDVETREQVLLLFPAEAALFGQSSRWLARSAVKPEPRILTVPL
jgi:hypothetical protein